MHVHDAIPTVATAVVREGSIFDSLHLSILFAECKDMIRGEIRL